MKQIRFLMIALMIIFADLHAWADPKEVVVKHNGRRQTVTYDHYAPAYKEGERLGVLICTGGLPMDGDKYLRSDTRECFGPAWTKFADDNRLLIVGLGFLFMPEDWEKKESYQYAQAWSGRALNEILERLGKAFPIDAHALYMYGVSAGAQFSVRFAQMRPESVVAVAAHAAGGFDEPKEYVPVKFLLTVGKLDNAEISRLDMAKEFVKLARKKGIDIRLKVISGLAHRQTEPQNILSRQFFQKAIKERRSNP
jgi:pimeloyl-ACP methyl ester carboxylesterase